MQTRSCFSQDHAPKHREASHEWQQEGANNGYHSLGVIIFRIQMQTRSCFSQEHAPKHREGIP